MLFFSYIPEWQLRLAGVLGYKIYVVVCINLLKGISNTESSIQEYIIAQAISTTIPYIRDIKLIIYPLPNSDHTK